MTGANVPRADPSGGRVEEVAGGPATGAGTLRFELHDHCLDDALVGFLTGNDWPFHPEPRLEPAAVLRRLGDGAFESSGDRECWWMLRSGGRVGLVVIFDLADPTPMFDLRIAASSRGRGYGTLSVRWLTERILTGWADKERVEATTRADNWAMRVVLARCGYAKEAHYRQAWPGADRAHDAVGYSILRSDWATGTTTPVDWDDGPAGPRSAQDG